MASCDAFRSGLSPDGLPASFVEPVSQRAVGLFPNDGLAIDQQVYVWLFEAGSTPQFAMVYHAGHPVSRHSSLSISPDYVGVIRSAIREKWSDMPVLFLQGCGADLRPRIVGRRISRLPFFWLNKKFVAPPSSQQQAWVDDSYRTAIESLEVIDSFACKPSDVVLDSATVRLRAQGDIEYPVIRFGDAFVSISFPSRCLICSICANASMIDHDFWCLVAAIR